MDEFLKIVLELNKENLTLLLEKAAELLDNQHNSEAQSCEKD
jgi:hypothetical protein